MDQKSNQYEDPLRAQQDVQAQEHAKKPVSKKEQVAEEHDKARKGKAAQKREGAAAAGQRAAVGKEFQQTRAQAGSSFGKAKDKANSSKKMPAKPSTEKEVSENREKDSASVSEYAHSKGEQNAAALKADKSQEQTGAKKTAKTSVAVKKDDKASSKKADKASAKNEDKSKKDAKKADKTAKKDETVANKKADVAGSKIAAKVEQAVAKKEEKSAEKADKAGNQADKAADKSNEKVAAKADKALEKGAKTDKVADKTSAKDSKGDKDAKSEQGKSESANKSKDESKKVAKVSDKAPSVGGGSFGGGGGPAITSKGEGKGANAIDAFANSGLSYQAMNISGLGAKADADVAKAVAETEGKLPGEKGASIKDDAADAASQEMAAATKSANANVKNASYDATLKTNMEEAANRAKEKSASQKSTVSKASDNLPDKPQMTADVSDIDAIAQEEAQKYSEAQSAGQSKVNELERNLPERGFSDLQAPRVDIENGESALQSGDVAMTAEVATLDEEAKGILDMTELASTAASSMSAAKTQVAEAENTRKAETEASVAAHDKAVEDARTKAEQEEQTMLAQQKSNLDAQVGAESAAYEQEISAHNASQKAEVAAAKAEIENERKKAQSDIDSEHSKGAKDKKAAEKEADKKKNGNKSWLQKAADWVKSQIDAITSWLKSKVASIVNTVKNAISKVLDAFVAVVSKINKNLGEKLRKAVEKFKDFLNKLAEKLIEIVNKIIDAVAEAVKAIVDIAVAAIQAAVDALKAAISAIVEAFKAAIQAAIEIAKAALAAIGEFFIAMLKKAMELAGVDPGIFANAMAVAKEIIKHPGRFFLTLGKGFILGFKQFGANIKQNVKAVFSNLFNMWLGTAGLSLPESFSVQSLIKFGLQIVGIDIDGILGKLGIEGGIASIKSMKDLKEGFANSTIGQFIQDVRENGISAIVKYIGEYLKDLAKSIMEEAIKTIVQKAATAAISKLAMLATPVSGIIAALKAVWDIIQFIRQNMSAIAGLVQAVTSTIGQAAAGDPSGVANGVEAALCRLIPLAIDLLLRLAGINVGGAIQKIVGKIRSKVSGAIDKLVGKLKSTKAGQVYQKAKDKYDATKEKIDNAKQAVTDKVDNAKNAVVGKAGEIADNAIAKVDSKVDPLMQNGMDMFNNSKTGQNVAKFNNGAQKFADGLNSWKEKASEKTSPVMSNIKKATEVLDDINSGKKIGDAYGLSSEKIANKLTGKDQAQAAEKNEESGKEAGETKDAELEKPAEQKDAETSKANTAVKEDVNSKDSKASEEKSVDKGGNSEISKKNNEKSREQLENERLQKETEKNNAESSMRFSQQMYDFYQEQLSKYEAEIAEDGKYYQEKKKQAAELETKYKGQTPQGYCDQYLAEFKQMLATYCMQRAGATTQAELLAVEAAYRNENVRRSFEFGEKLQQLCIDYQPVQVAIVERDIAKENLSSHIRAYEQYEAKAEEEMRKLNGLKAKVEQIHEEISSLDAQIAQFGA